MRAFAFTTPAILILTLTLTLTAQGLQQCEFLRENECVDIIETPQRLWDAALDCSLNNGRLIIPESPTWANILINVTSSLSLGNEWLVGLYGSV